MSPVHTEAKRRLSNEEILEQLGIGLHPSVLLDAQKADSVILCSRLIAPARYPSQCSEKQGSTNGNRTGLVLGREKRIAV